MGVLSPYVGKYVSAESATDYIDIGAITSGCNAAISEASIFNSIASRVNTTTVVLDAKTFSVDGYTIQNNSDEACNYILSLQNNIIDTCNSILSQAEAAYNNIQEQLNQDAYQRDQEMILYYSKKGESSYGA